MYVCNKVYNGIIKLLLGIVKILKRNENLYLPVQYLRLQLELDKIILI